MVERAGKPKKKSSFFPSWINTNGEREQGALRRTLRANADAVPGSHPQRVGTQGMGSPRARAVGPGSGSQLQFDAFADGADVGVLDGCEGAQAWAARRPHGFADQCVLGARGVRCSRGPRSLPACRSLLVPRALPASLSTAPTSTYDRHGEKVRPTRRGVE